MHFRAVPRWTQRLLQERVCHLRASSVGGPREGSRFEGVGEQAVSCVALNSHQHTRWAGLAQFPEQPSEAWPSALESPAWVWAGLVLLPGRPEPG